MKDFIVLLLLAATVFVVSKSLLRRRSAAPLSRDESILLGRERICCLSQGWSQPEIDKILADFTALYADDGVKLKSSRLTGNVFRIDFPEGIESRHAEFLVNYLDYPADLDLQGRDIRNVAAVVLGPEFGIPSGLAGCKAVIYVPANDEEYDLVYGRLENGEAFRVSFGDNRWVDTGDARWRPALDEVARLALAQLGR